MNLLSQSDRIEVSRVGIASLTKCLPKFASDPGEVEAEQACGESRRCAVQRGISAEIVDALRNAFSAEKRPFEIDTQCRASDASCPRYTCHARRSHGSRVCGNGWPPSFSGSETSPDPRRNIRVAITRRKSAYRRAPTSRTTT